MRITPPRREPGGACPVQPAPRAAGLGGGDDLVRLGRARVGQALGSQPLVGVDGVLVAVALVRQQRDDGGVRVLPRPPVGDLEGRAAGRAHEQAVPRVQLAGRGERLGGADPVHLVVAFVRDVGRHQAVAEPAQHARAVGLAEDRAALGVDADQVQLGGEHPQERAGAGRRPAGADRADQAVRHADRLGELLGDQRVGRRVVGIAVLAGHPVVRVLRAQLLQPVEPGALEPADRAGLRADLDAGAEVLEAALQRRVDRRVADDRERVAAQAADHREAEAEGARRRLEHGGAGAHFAAFFGAVEHEPGGQQLHQAEGGDVEAGPDADDPGQLGGFHNGPADSVAEGSGKGHRTHLSVSNCQVSVTSSRVAANSSRAGVSASAASKIRPATSPLCATCTCGGPGGAGDGEDVVQPRDGQVALVEQGAGGGDAAEQPRVAIVDGPPQQAAQRAERLDLPRRVARGREFQGVDAAPARAGAETQHGQRHQLAEVFDRLALAVREDHRAAAVHQGVGRGFGFDGERADLGRGVRRPVAASTAPIADVTSAVDDPKPRQSGMSLVMSSSPPGTG